VDSPTTPNTTPAPPPTPAEAVTQPIATTDDRPAPQGARIHTVRQGESLWTIAERLVAPNASTTEIAEEVARLWDLNRDQIGSGDPNVIFAGTELRLR
jgi:Tfp pilus assembly protein FimV